MIFNKYLGSQEIDLDTGLIIDDSLIDCYGGGKSAPVQAQQPIIQPTPPVEEASVELDEEDKERKANTGKSTLKVPLATSSSVGLKV